MADHTIKIIKAFAGLTRIPPVPPSLDPNLTTFLLAVREQARTQSGQVIEINNRLGIGRSTDGIAGADGEEGRGVEYIFYITAQSTIPPDLPDNVWHYDRPQAGWTDGAPNLSNNIPYLWRSERAVPGSPEPEAVPDSDTWGEWSEPVIVAHFGKDGVDGLQGLQGVAGIHGVDGEGIEYIFIVTTLHSDPVSIPDNTWAYDQPQSGWSDGAPGLNTIDRVLWRASRRVPGSPEVGDIPTNDWGGWSIPVVVGRFGVDGDAGLTGIAGADGSEGAPGIDGQGIEYIFYSTSSPNAPTITPDNDWFYDQPQSGWTDGASSIIASAPFVWRSDRRVPGRPAVGSAPTSVWGNWSTPIIVARRGAAGNDGIDGADGQGVEYIYHKTTDAASPPLPLNTWPFDQPQGGWKDGQNELSIPLDTPNTTYYIWYTQRAVPGTPPLGATPTEAWGDWEEPTVLRWPAEPGEPGPAGVGSERIFALTTLLSPPSDPLNTWAYSSPVSPWLLSAPSVTTEKPNLWYTQRQVEGSPRIGDPKEDSWSDWAIPVLIGQIGIHGVAGIDGATGADGSSIGLEYIFASAPLSYENAKIPLPDNNWGFDDPDPGILNQGTGFEFHWYDTPLNLSIGLPLLYSCDRQVIGVPETGDAVPALWSFPRLVGKYGADGRDGATGATGIPGIVGANGVDGLGVEYVFRRTITEIRPTQPSFSWLYDRPQSGWTDAAGSLSDLYRFLWRSQRSVPGAPIPGSSPGSGFSSWTIPIIVARVAGIGITGQDIFNTETIYRLTSTIITPLGPSNAFPFEQPTPPWYDAGPSVTTSMPYRWEAMRAVPGSPPVGTASNLAGFGDWSTPLLVVSPGLPGIAPIFVSGPTSITYTGSSVVGYSDFDYTWTQDQITIANLTLRMRYTGPSVYSHSGDEINAAINSAGIEFIPNYKLHLWDVTLTHTSSAVFINIDVVWWEPYSGIIP